MPVGSITEISDDSGFSDVRYFREVFRKYYGMSPRSTKDGEYSVYANSRTTASITYTIVTTEYNVVKQAVTKASLLKDDWTLPIPTNSMLSSNLY